MHLSDKLLKFRLRTIAVPAGLSTTGEIDVFFTKTYSFASLIVPLNGGAPAPVGAVNGGS